MPGHDRTAGAKARHQRGFSRARAALLCPRRPDTGEAGSHQPSSNAIKYNRAGGTVIVDCVASTPGRIRIGVTDTGEGLTQDKLAQLFQPFNRLGQEAKVEEGTGIGLVVAKRLIELMGGVIGAESTVGKGSVFWIEVSLTAEPQPVASAAEP